MKKNVKDVCCKGRMPGTSKECGKILYQSDGEFLYVNNYILNRDLIFQRIECDNCGFTAIWKRNKEYRDERKQRRAFDKYKKSER